MYHLALDLTLKRSEIIIFQDIFTPLEVSIIFTAARAK